MAVSTKSLQVYRIVIPTITVYVIYIKLTDMYWVKAAVFAVILLMGCVWV